MRAFIVRPFGTRKTAGTTPLEIDFERVERELISPALSHHGIEGRTTLELAHQHNIRIDMFQRLVTADIVIADVSIHNANVFYELGIRHALRDRHTFLLRCRADDVPFDLRTDRYLEYDHTAPAGALATLIEALAQTLRADHDDSPVFQLLPELEPEDPARFIVVPRGFTEEVERAQAANDAGTLELLGEEVLGLAWESQGLRQVGRAQFKLKAWEGARGTWDSLLRIRRDDSEALTKLGTIYQRLASAATREEDRIDLFTRSDQALRRLLDKSGIQPYDRAEAHSLLGSNEKVRWRADFASAAPADRRAEALRSPHLENARLEYANGFAHDCNHYYSGLNALALLTVQIDLADALPPVWEERFEEETRAAFELAQRKIERERIAAAVDWSIRAAEIRMRNEGRSDLWIAISRADLRFLMSGKPPAVATAYRNALANASPLDVEAVARQIALYEQLGVLDANVAAVLPVLEGSGGQIEAPAAAPRVLVFTGHRVDAPGRATPRFPPDRVPDARAAIRSIVEEELELATGRALGISGAASGGDILFQEICEELGIPTLLYLAVPAEEYQVASVKDGGPGWVERFWALCRRVTPRVLQGSATLPDWLQDRKDYSIWQRNNLWMLHHALARGGGANVTLIALWDGEAQGDGPGGTADMVRKAESRGAKLRHIDTKQLFGL